MCVVHIYMYINTDFYILFIGSPPLKGYLSKYFIFFLHVQLLFFFKIDFRKFFLPKQKNLHFLSWQGICPPPPPGPPPLKGCKNVFSFGRIPLKPFSFSWVKNAGEVKDTDTNTNWADDTLPVTSNNKVQPVW